MKIATLTRFLRYVARTVLIMVALFWFSFAVLSGVAEGIVELLANFPNTLPWLALLLIVFIAFRRELMGGALALTAGVASVFFFNAWAAPAVLLGIALPLIVAGAALIACYYLDRSDQGTRY